MPNSRFFRYGWFIVAVAWVCYGFGISPAYYSWSRLAEELIADLNLSRARFGLIFGLFTFLYSFVGIFVGPSMARWGVRPVMVFGFISSALGFFYLSRAESMVDCFIGFSILGGCGIGFATIVPCQTIGQNWFLKRRALALALIFTAGGIVGKIVPIFDQWMINAYSWRTAWVVIAGVSAALAVFSILFIRDTPEQVGLHRDGATKDEEKATVEAMLKSAGGAAANLWTAAQAIRTRQFAMLVVCGVAYAVPWGVVVPHLTLHMTDIGYETAVAGSFLGTLALISIAGRLFAGIGDFLPAHTVLAVSLLMEGVGGLLFADNIVIAYASITLIALGFGTAYISIPVIFSHFFGRKAFGTTSGVRITITGIFNGAGPWVAGIIFDKTGAYTIPFLGLMILCFIGTVAAAMLRHPGAPTGAATRRHT